MTTDLRALLRLLPLAAFGWIGLLALVMRLSGAAPAALVILPQAGFAANLPLGIAITSSGPFSLTLRGNRPGLVAQLYDAGAWLVLPAGLTGCIGQP